MIKIILVPLDGGERSAEVLDTALVIAARFDAHIKVVHVSTQGQELFSMTGVPESMRQQFTEMNQKMVGSVADSVRDQFKSFCQR